MAGVSDEDDDTPSGNTIEDGDSVEVQGSSSTYTLSRQGTVYMCSCPAWKNQSAPIDGRTCKHLRAYLGEDAEIKRLGTLPSRAASTKSGGGSGAKAKETAPPILLAHKWETHHDPTSWWMSEKLDGVRAYWDGEAFVSRLGNRFFAPDWFVEDLPADTLDGELWVDRKKFSKTISIVRSGAAGQEWKDVRYVIFDAPNAKGGFEERIAHAKKVIERAAAPHANVLDHVQCEGFEHLKEELARVEALGGEGLMLRRPGSKYEIGRSQSLLKVKTFHDTEARVIDHAPGAGKHKGRLGALVCQLPDGTTFNVGTGFTDAERQNPPKIGSVITFRYQELTDDGVPRFPSYVGERIDVELPSVKKVAAVATAVIAKGAKKALPRDDGDGEPPLVKAKAKTPPPPDDDDDDGAPPDDDDDDDAQFTPSKKAAPTPKPRAPAPIVETPAPGDPTGKKFMFTGKLASMSRKEAQARVTEIGGLVAGSVSRDLDYLVVGDDGSPLFGAGTKGDKIISAERLIAGGAYLKIISERAFMQMKAPSRAAKPAAVMPAKPKRVVEPEDDDDDDDDEPVVAPTKQAKAAPPEPEEPEDDADSDDETAPDYRKGKPDYAVKLVNDDENKFWEIEVRGAQHITRFGKIGSQGQMRLTEIGSASAARTDAEKRAIQKRKEGYRTAT